MIEALGLSRTFLEPHGAVAALREVSLTARAGEITGLLGPNGAGKTTLFRVLSGLLRADAGSARIHGHDVRADPLAARRSLGLVTEEPGLPDRLTPEWHVALHGALRGLAWKEARDRSRALLGEMGLGDAMRRRCARLSRGERLRVSLARALIGRPAVLLLDEPTSALDIEAAAELRARMKRFASEGAAILLATHNPHEAEDLCAVVHVLRQGATLAHGAPEDLRRCTGTSSLEKAYLALQAEAAAT